MKKMFSLVVLVLLLAGINRAAAQCSQYAETAWCSVSSSGGNPSTIMASDSWFIASNTLLSYYVTVAAYGYANIYTGAGYRHYPSGGDPVSASGQISSGASGYLELEAAIFSYSSGYATISASW